MGPTRRHPVVCMQMAGYVSIDNLSSGLSQTADAIAGFFSLRLPQSTAASRASNNNTSAFDGICVSESLTAVSKVKLGVVLPFAVAGAMCVILACSWCVSKYRLMNAKPAAPPRRSVS